MGNVKTLEKDFRTVIYQNLHNHDYRPLQNKKQYSRKLVYHGLFQRDAELKEISRERTELFLLLFYTSMISCSFALFFHFLSFFFFLPRRKKYHKHLCDNKGYYYLSENKAFVANLNDRKVHYARWAKNKSIDQLVVRPLSIPNSTCKTQLTDRQVFCIGKSNMWLFICEC